jgi:hypothetical protein
MAADRENTACVNAWMAGVPAAPPIEVIAALEQGFTALWRCSCPPIAAPALSAVITQVLRDGATRFPALAYASTAGGAGIRVEELRAHARPQDAQQLREGTRYVLEQFIDIVGKMNHGALMPALRVALDEHVPGRIN